MTCQNISNAQPAIENAMASCEPFPASAPRKQVKSTTHASLDIANALPAIENATASHKPSLNVTRGPRH